MTTLPPGRKPRPTIKFKTAKGRADAETRRLKRAGLIPKDVTPSRTKPVRRHYDALYAPRRKAYFARYNALRRRRRADARALKTAPVDSPEFFRACLSLPDAPTNPDDLPVFVWLKGIERLARGPAIPQSDPGPPVIRQFDSEFSVTPSRPRRQRAVKATAPTAEPIDWSTFRVP